MPEVQAAAICFRNVSQSLCSTALPDSQKRKGQVDAAAIFITLNPGRQETGGWQAGRQEPARLGTRVAERLGARVPG